MKIKIKKKEGEVQYIAQAKRGSRLWAVEAHTAAQGRFYISKYSPHPVVLGTRPILQMIARRCKCRCYK